MKKSLLFPVLFLISDKTADNFFILLALALVYRDSLFFPWFGAKFVNFGQISTKLHVDSKIFPVLFAVLCVGVTDNN